ncbi:GntR family transcriptional regulator [Embleya hyalina]|uniref:GntR family transcriptional regulator n=1 Tax=Embleya hyalina TaxID=516124 RepID=A0A401YQK5_9ACTN|nr:GntR family transcriptional regulator [Embleya hyalina]GCD96825.1 GntR family transcriptional regulator [Embleya hyalina]
MTTERTESTNELSAGEATYRKLRALMLSGRFAQGDRLAELELSEELRVSRTPVREALRRLQADGLVRPSGRGVVLASLPAAHVGHSYRLRASLESLAARLSAERQAAGHIAPSEIVALRGTASAMEEATRALDLPEMTRSNLELHRAIATLSGNPLLEEALGRLWDRIAVSSLSNLHDAQWAREALVQHGQLLDAIAAGTPDAADEIAGRHVMCAARVYERHTSQSDD